MRAAVGALLADGGRRPDGARPVRGSRSRREAWLGVGAVGGLHRRRAAEPEAGAAAGGARRPPARAPARRLGRLAHENAVRNPGRTASTAAALMIGLALVSFVAIFAAGLKGSIDDAIDESITRRPLPREHRRLLRHPGDLESSRLAAIEGVEAASPLRFTQYGKAPGGVRRRLVHADRPRERGRRAHLEWKDGGRGELLTDMGPTDAVLDENFAEDAGPRGRRHVPRADAPRGRRSTTRSRAPSRTRPTSSATTPPPTRTPPHTARTETRPTCSSSATTAPTPTRSACEIEQVVERASRPSRSRTSRS